MNTPKTRTLCVVGTPPEVAARINALLDEQRTRLESRWRTAHQGSADVLLIDSESVYGHMDWLKAQASGRLVVALASAPESGHSDHWLRIPVVAADLVALLNRIDGQLAGKPTASVTPIRVGADTSTPVAAPVPAAAKVSVAGPRMAAPAIPTVPAVPAPETQHAASMELPDLLRPDPLRTGRLHLQAEGLPDIWLDPHTQTWHATASLKGVSGWCTRALATSEVKTVSEAQHGTATSTLAAQPYARLQWLASLVRGNGNLDPGLAQNGRYKLSRWPQSEREFPKHFRIATMMLKSAAPIDEIAELSGATTADVVNFINAYHALDFIEQEPAERAQDESRRGGLFGRARKTSVAS